MRARGIYNPLGYAGNIAGSFLGGIMISLIGYKSTFFGYTLLNLVIAGLIRYGLSSSLEQRISLVMIVKMALSELRSGLWDLPAVGREGGPYTLWCLGISIRGFGIALFGPVLTIYLVNVLHATKPQIGLFTSVAFLVRLLAMPPLGMIVDRYGPKGNMIIGLLLVVVHPLVFVSIPEVSWLVFVYVLSGVYWAFIVSGWFTWQMNLMPSNRGVYAGFFEFVNGLAWAFGTLLGGFLGGVAGIRFTAFLSSLLVFISVFIMMKVPERIPMEGEQISVSHVN